MSVSSSFCKEEMGGTILVKEGEGMVEDKKTQGENLLHRRGKGGYSLRKVVGGGGGVS